MKHIIGTKTAAILLTLLMILSALTLSACDEKEPPAEKGESETFAVTYNGITLELGASAETALEGLGKAKTEQEVFDCGAGNSRMYYRYSSFELYVLKTADGKEIIDQIELNDDLAQTREGVAIGTSETDLRATYGEPDSEEEGVLTYHRGNCRLIVELEDGKVSDVGLLRKGV